MENNSDKLLRDKLSGTEFPFDPQAWEQMEAMLDKKKKRRGFFWWWLSGVAAVSLLAVSALVIKQTTDNGQQTTANTVTVGSKQLAVGKKEKSEITDHRSDNATEAGGSSGLQEKAKDKSQKLKVSTRGNSSTALISAHAPGHRHQHAHVFSKENKQLAIGAKQQHNNSKQQRTNNKPVTPIQKEIEMLNAASAQASAQENISLSRREASLLEYVSEKAITSFDKKEEDALPKQTKKIFNYSIGVLGNVTGTTLGKQTTIPNVPIRSALFYSQPSYMVGFTHDFLFVNRVAITNSILFSQTSFKVYQPNTTSFSVNPVSYTSHITELAIPIGIKVYPVVKNNLRFYINTGIINHIKLKETFDYSLSDTFNNSITSTPNTLADQSGFPYETKFTGNYSPSVFGVQGGSNSTKDFSINNARRYYASFYAGAGFEYVAKKHFILFTEPMFYMSLQKIGVQDRRKYNLGLTGGFRYQF